jgi:hypothetical protein
VNPPAVPKSSVTPTPTPVPPATTAPAKAGRAWVTPTDPYQKQENASPTLNNPALARADRPSEIARSTEALVGLGGIFLLLAGTVAIGWTRFRRYDDRRLDEILNPEGKLPTHLDPKAKDMGEEKEAPKRGRKAPPLPAAAPLSAAQLRNPVKGGRGRGVLAHLSDEEKASMSEEELEALRQEYRRERRKIRRAKRKAVLPTFDPTDAAAVAAAAAAGVAGAEAGVAKAEKGPRPKVKAKPQKERRWLRRKAPLPADSSTPADAASATPAKPVDSPPPADTTQKPVAEQPDHAVPNGKPPPQAIPPITAPHVNGGSHDQGPAGNGSPPAHRTYREQVEAELQRILDDAGLHTEVDGILADAKAEAQRQGVPIDADLMLKALCEDTNGVARLSDSAKGELELRFKRIVAEERGERGERGSAPGSQPPRG